MLFYLIVGFLLLSKAILVLNSHRSSQKLKDDTYIEVQAEIVDSVYYKSDGYAAVYKYTYMDSEYISEGIPMSLKPYNNGAITTIRINPAFPNEIDTHGKSKMVYVWLELTFEIVGGIACFVIAILQLINLL